MIRRVFWMSVGAAVGIYVVHKVTATARSARDSLSPSGIASTVGGFGDSVRDFAEDVRTGMRQREAELRDALGIPDTNGA